jgi:hypothetical protein
MLYANNLQHGFLSIHLRSRDVLFWTVQQLIRYQQPIVGETLQKVNTVTSG